MAYSRRGYAALIKETTENVPIKPTFFFGFTKFDVVTKWGVKSSNNIFTDRSLFVNPVKMAVEAPTGKLTFQLEPKFMGYPLRAAMGAGASGNYFPVSAVAGTFQVGETITGGSSAKTATVVAISNEKDYLLVSSPSGAFTAGETITGGSSAATATLGVTDNTVYGQEMKAPANDQTTYTLEIGYENEAVRFTGVRFPSIESITDKDNIIGATLGVFARSAFISSRVQAVVASGSTKVILLDQTLGLTTADTVKVFRPGTGYLDFSGSGVKTSAISTIVSETSITVPTLQTALQAGDLIVLAPQTPSFNTQTEFAWIGAALVSTGDSITAALSNAPLASSIESADLTITNETDSRHAANAVSVAGRFPSFNAFKGFKASGKFKRAYQDMTFLDRLRNSTQTGIRVVYNGGIIGATKLNYVFDLRFANGRLGAYHPSVETDALLDEAMTVDFYRSVADGYTVKALLITDTVSY